MTSAQILQDYKATKTRLLMLDYDGTLMPFKPNPPLAKPTKVILNLLERLASDPLNKLVIISGREHANLEEWFGGLPLDIAAEHGLFVKEPGRPWQQMLNTDNAWKKSIMPVMQDYVQRAPGSFTEEKTSTLGWHYRTVEPRLASKLAPGLLSQLREIAPGLGLSILNGDRVIEAKPGNFSKGTVTRYWLGQQNWDFTLAAGDDVTDEDLFAAMPPSAHTVKIGPGATNAQTRLPDPSAMLKLLDSLAKT